MISEKKRTSIVFSLLLVIFCLLLGCNNPWIEEIWELKTIWFDTRGGDSIPSQNLLKGEKIKKPDDPVKANYKFTSWFDDDPEFSLSAKEWDFDIAPTKNMTLFADWREYGLFVDLLGDLVFNPDDIGYTSIRTLPVTVKNTTDEDIDVIITSSAKFTVSPASFTLLAHNELEFHVSTVLGLLAENHNDTITISGGGYYTSFGVWFTVFQINRTVTFDLNYIGAPSGGSQTVGHGDTLIIGSSDPERDGYRFEGWFYDIACANAWDEDDTITEDITLYAKWTEIPVINITTQPPATTDATVSEIAGGLSLTTAATVTMGGSVSYQWYSNTENSNSGGTEILGASSATFNLPTNLEKGTYYYFCEVRATGADSVRTIVAIVNVGLEALPSIGAFSYIDVSTVYDGTGKTASVSYTASYNSTTAGEFTVYYGSSVADAVSTAPRNVGNYNVYVATEGGTTYGALEKTLLGELEITQLQLTIDSPTGTPTKVYDGDTSHTGSGITIGSLTNLAGSDVVTVGIASATYNDKNVLSANTITIVYEITGGAAAGNYTAPANDTIIASITRAAGAAVTTPVVSGSPANDSISVGTVTVDTAFDGTTQSAEYAISTQNITDGSWPTVSSAPDSISGGVVTFTGLTENTTYYVYARSVQNDNFNYGDSERSEAIKTTAGQTLGLDFEDIEQSPDLNTNIIIHRNAINGITSYKIDLIEPEQYDSISWSVNGKQKGDEGSFTLVTTDIDYNDAGSSGRSYSLMLRVEKDGSVYNTTIEFKVMP